MIILGCGPMNVVLHELKLPRLMIAEKNSFENLANSLPGDLLEKIVIGGFDVGVGVPAYNREDILKGGESLLRKVQK